MLSRKLRANAQLSHFMQVLEQLTGQQPVFGRARYTVRTFAIRRNEKISCSVTVRGDKAMQLLVSLTLPSLGIVRGGPFQGSNTINTSVWYRSYLHDVSLHVFRALSSNQRSMCRLACCRRRRA